MCFRWGRIEFSQHFPPLRTRFSLAVLTEANVTISHSIQRCHAQVNKAVHRSVTSRSLHTRPKEGTKGKKMNIFVFLSSQTSGFAAGRKTCAWNGLRTAKTEREVAGCHSTATIFRWLNSALVWAGFPTTEWKATAIQHTKLQHPCIHTFTN